MTLIDSTTFSATILVTMGILISWKLALASLILLPILAYTMTKYGKVVHARFTLAQDVFGDMNDRVLETVAGICVDRDTCKSGENNNGFVKRQKMSIEKMLLEAVRRNRRGRTTIIALRHIDSAPLNTLTSFSSSTTEKLLNKAFTTN